MDDDSADGGTGFEGLGQKHWKSDRVKDLEREERHAPRPGYVQVYTGDGKGKTTASLGLVCRAAGYGHRSCIVSFLKGDPNYGELRFIREHMPMVDYHLAGRMNFVDPSDPDPADIEIAVQGMQTAREAIASGDYHLVVLDEVNVAVNLGLVDEDDVLALCDDRPEHVELVFTGRDASPRIVERADLVTEMRMVKHFYEAGIPARRGIEF
ncbi:MAG: cob(I)yrinic acid a,c-diamide adenosyltransferase [Thermoleophilia bacterium]|nr:cob(I)yrinic acid a,c-diamide adenosyltransferase [Thermoleophilia bacterium]